MLQKLSTAILESQAAGSAVRLCESLLELDTTDLRSITFKNQLSSSTQLSLSIFKLCWFIDLTLEDKQTHTQNFVWKWHHHPLSYPIWGGDVKM